MKPLFVIGLTELTPMTSLFWFRWWRMFAICAAASLLTNSLAAQSPSQDSILARIGRIASDSSHLERLAHSLVDSIGPRLTGSPELLRGNDWLVRTYRSWGIDARNERVGTWRGWRRGHSRIELVSPRVRSLEGTMLAYSPGTGKIDVTAETVILPRFADSTEFVRWLPAARNRLVLVSAPRPSCRPTESWAENATEPSARRYAAQLDSVRREWGGANIRGTGFGLALGTGELGLRMEQAGVAGMITSRPRNAWGTVEIFETYNTRAPAITLSCEDYGLVHRLARGGGARITINLDAELLGEQPVFNTVATVRGSAKPAEYVVLSAHFDSWDGSSGATDNATGTLVMMEAMRILRRVYPRPKRTIVAGHWQGEEQGGSGSQAFAEDHPEIIRGLQALFNQDNGTGRIVRIGGAGLPNASDHLSSWLARLPEPLRTQVTYNGPGRPAGPGSDDFSFSCRGVPAFGLYGLSWNYGSYTWHTNRDTYDKIVFDDVRSNAALVAMLVYLASEDPTMITRERIAEVEPTRAPGSAGVFRWPECTRASRSTQPRL